MREFSYKIYTALAQGNPLGNAADLDLPNPDAGANTINDVVNILLFVAGGLSVVFIIVGGLMYVFSAGNPDTGKKARSTILYALIGLAVTLLAYAIVKLVLRLIIGEDI